MINIEKAMMINKFKNDFELIRSGQFLFVIHFHYKYIRFACWHKKDKLSEIYPVCFKLKDYKLTRVKIVEYECIERRNCIYDHVISEFMGIELLQWLYKGSVSFFEYKFDAEVPLIAQIDWTNDGEMLLMDLQIDWDDYSDTEFVKNNEDFIHEILNSEN